jgi:tripartite ATP-independent transporter DctP family solute receptor
VIVSYEAFEDSKRLFYGFHGFVCIIQTVVEICKQNVDKAPIILYNILNNNKLFVLYEQNLRRVLMNRKALSVVLVLILVCICMSWTEGKEEAAAKPITLKLGHSYPPSSPIGQAADLFAERVAEETNGQINVEVFPSEQLGPAKDELESTMLGNQDIFLEGAVWYERWSKTLRLLMIPFAFEDRAHFRKWNETDDWKNAWAQVTEQTGLVFLDPANWERGPFRLIISKKPIESVDDLKGLKMRVWPSDAYKRSWEALGAKPTELAWNDVYLGLKLGTVDAVTSPVNLLYSMKFTEVAKYVIYWPEFPQIVRAAMNKDRYDSLPAQQQRVLRDAAEEAGELYSELSLEVAMSDIEKVKAEHGAIYKKIDLKPAAERMSTVMKTFEESGYLPVGVYDRIRELVE